MALANAKLYRVSASLGSNLRDCIYACTAPEASWLARRTLPTLFQASAFRTGSFASETACWKDRRASSELLLEARARPRFIASAPGLAPRHPLAAENKLSAVAKSRFSMASEPATASLLVPFFSVWAKSSGLLTARKMHKVVPRRRSLLVGHPPSISRSRKPKRKNPAYWCR